MIHGVFIRAPACSSPTNPVCVCVFCVPIFTCVFTCVCLRPHQSNPTSTTHTPSREVCHPIVGRAFPLNVTHKKCHRKKTTACLFSLRSGVALSRTVVVVFFTLTDRASTIPSNIRGCQSGTRSAGQKNIRGTSTKLQREQKKNITKQNRNDKRKGTIITLPDILRWTQAPICV